MRLLADESFPKPIVDALRADSSDVLWARTDCRGWKDPVLLDFAESEACIMLTLDEDVWQLRTTPSFSQTIRRRLVSGPSCHSRESQTASSYFCRGGQNMGRTHQQRDRRRDSDAGCSKELRALAALPHPWDLHRCVWGWAQSASQAATLANRRRCRSAAEKRAPT